MSVGYIGIASDPDPSLPNPSTTVAPTSSGWGTAAVVGAGLGIVALGAFAAAPRLRANPSVSDISRGVAARLGKVNWTQTIVGGAVGALVAVFIRGLFEDDIKKLAADLKSGA